MILRQIIRDIVRSPGISLSVIFLVALGVGGSGAIFSIARPVLLKPLPFPESNEIVTLRENSPAHNSLQVSPPDLEDIRSRSRMLSELASYRSWGGTISGRGPAEQLSGAEVSPEFFRVLATYPFLGREFVQQEFTDGEQVVLISYSLWRQRFGSDPNIGNQHIKLEGVSYSVVGVMPSGFDFPSNSVPTQIWLPLHLSVVDLGNRSSRSLQVIGRLRDRLSVQDGQKELSAVAAEIAKEHPDTNSHVGATLTSLQVELSGPYRPGMLVLLGASILLVLISCANSSALLLAKGVGRQNAITIRKALGATDIRIIREQLYESLFLSLLGAALGVAVSELCLMSVHTWISSTPFSDQIRIDPVTVGFALMVAIGSAIVFGIVPALRAARMKDISSALRGGTGLRTKEARNIQTVLVVSETALALVLVVAAGLLIRTVVGIWSVPIGFNPNNVLTMNFLLPHTPYPTAHSQIQFFKSVSEGIGRLPAIKGVALASPLPWEGEIGVDFQVEGRINPTGGSQANLVVCSPSFFGVMEVPLIRGRVFTDVFDRSNSAKIAVINQVMANRFWNGQDPLGKTINVEGAGKREIVGIIGDFHQSDFMELPQPAIFIPYSQSPTPYAGVILRSTTDPRTIIDPIRREIATVDPDIAPASYDTMKETLHSSIEQRSFVMVLLIGFSVIALLLTTIGMYGFISRLIAMRRREFAVRIAVGASPASVLRMVMGRGMFLTVLGSVLGIVISLVATKLLSSLLWGVKTNDFLTYLLALCVLFSVNLLALYRPSRQAMLVSPSEILHEE